LKEIEFIAGKGSGFDAITELDKEIVCGVVTADIGFDSSQKILLFLGN
jgi:hypothetical protein